MTAREFTLYLLMTAGGLIGVRWGILAAWAGVNAILDGRRGVGGDEQ